MMTITKIANSTTARPPSTPPTTSPLMLLLEFPVGARMFTVDTILGKIVPN